MLPHDPELGQTLLDVGRHFIEVSAIPGDSNGFRHRAWPAIGVDLPPDVLARLKRHRRPLLALLATGYTPVGEEANAILDARLLVTAAAGVPFHPGSPAWLVITGECLGGKWETK
jgi:hypothetical protein